MELDFLRFQTEMDRVEALVRGAVSSKDGLVTEVADYIHLGAGKKLRARLLVLVAHATGGVNEQVFRMAACVELVHSASLLHDDVIDAASERRGRPSVNARYGDAVAILMADLLYGQAFDQALGAVDPEVMRIIARATRHMCESEMFQIEKSGAILTEEEYLRIIRTKTAILFSSCAELGGVLNSVAHERRRALADFGLHLGMAFQIVDDNLDYSGADSRLGKPLLNDLAQGKQTLPLVHALENATAADRKDLMHILSNGRDITAVSPYIEKYEGLEYSHKRATEFAVRAEELVEDLDAGERSEQFRDLCRFVVARTY